MGVNTRKPLLPAPTDSSFLDTGGSAAGTDLATDISRRTDRTSYSIPDDGSPITISTSRRRHHRDRDEGRLTRSSHNQSQTSLLIEYFEGGKKGGNISSRPSVRVKVTPSAARKLKDQNDHIQISETGSGRKPSYTRRISLGTPSRTRELTEGALDDQSVSSITSTPDDTNTHRRPPLEIELLKDPSEVSSRYIQPTSDISSMPADSMLDSAMAVPTSRHRRSHSVSGDEAHEDKPEKDMLKTPSRRRSRSLSRERIAHKAAEKLSSTPRDVSHVKHRRGEKSRSRTVSKELLDSDVKSSRKRSSKHRDKDIPSAESSLLSNSALSPQAKSGDQYSFRSGTSKSSMNNPRLLETVEDAIRRLILPELKELKKDQKTEHNRKQFERDANASRRSASINSRDEFGRRLSKHSSAPDVTKPRLIVSSDSKESGILVSEGKSKEHKREKHRSSRHDRSQSRKLSVDSTATDEALQRKRSKGLRDAEAAKIVGTALTAAALKQQDSNSSLDKRERQKKRSKSRSRSATPVINETEVVFEMHGVPQMPFRSDIDSELTRESILTQQTENAVEPRQGEVARGSPGVGLPMSRTPTRTPRGSTRGLKLDDGDVVIPAPVDRSPSSQGVDDDNTRTPVAEDTKLTDYGSLDEDPFTVSNYPKNRALSPIQSVASYRDGESDHDETVETIRHVNSSGSDKKGIAEDEGRLSIGSLSSAPSTDMARSTRAADHDGTKPGHILDESERGVDLGYEESPRESPVKRSMDFHQASDDEHLSSEHEQYDDDDGYIKRMTQTTNGSVDESFDPGQQVAKGVAANVEYVHTPVGVESAVASLFDPSMVDLAPYRSGNNSAAGSLHRYQHASSRSLGGARDLAQTASGSPLKQQQNAASPAENSFQKRMGVTSPPQSVASSHSEQLDQPIMGATALPGAGSPIPEIGHIPESEESEINTNPSIIQGPIGGVSHEARDHWPYNPTPPQQSKDIATDPAIDVPSNAKGLPIDGLGVDTAEAQRCFDQPYYPPYDDNAYAALDNVHPDQTREFYPGIGLTSPGVKDEGYISAANPASAGTPEPKGKGLAAFDADVPGLGADDPFSQGHNRHMSGYSHGMPSPLYDSATGRGIDRIQSKDIVALMDHLTVRDAQRNARDTEILVTLVRSAAEMRNSFEDMKKFMAEQDERLMDSNEKQHERTQKVIGGPRPQPPSAARTPRQIPVDGEEDLQSKRKSIFRRALKGLSMKNNNDLSNIEDMLVRLLMEVEALRAAQDGKTTGTATLQTSANSADNIHTPAQNGYEPEGRAGTSSNEEPAAFSNSPLNVAGAGAGRRISPVLEDDEDLEDLEPLNSHEQQLLDQHMTSDPNLMSRHRRGGSVPLATPPRVAVASGALSTDTTPKMSAEKSRKHKSSSSSFFPKISRWSKTTASSFGDNIRNSIQTVRKERPTSEMSRSGSDLGQRLYETEDFYDPQGDDRIRSNSSLARRRENRPPSPLVPSQVSEDPKYRAHRNSLNLQHPQPRQGPTSRYQTHLESQAQNYDHLSPASEGWGSNLSLPNAGNGPDARQSPMSDGGYSQTSSAVGRRNAPPRPPKIRDEDPLVPQRPPKVKEDSQGSYAERMVSRGGDPMGREVTNESPTRSSPGVRTPQRKPTGPRPITSSGRRQM